jgi:hypothetical protein
VACCNSKSKGDPYCTESLGNTCSPTFKAGGISYYDYCPGTFNETICGPAQLTAMPDAKTFAMGSNFRLNSSSANQTGKVCIYEIKAP